MSVANDLAKMVVAKIEGAGGWAIRLNSGVVFSDYTTKAGEQKRRAIRLAPAGTADVIGHSPDGVFIACEVKAGKDTLKDDQLMFLLGVIDRRGVAVVVRDSPQALYDLIEAITQRRPAPSLAVKATRRYMIAQVLDAYRHDHSRLPGWTEKYEREIEPPTEGKS